MAHSFDMLTFDFLLKPPQPFTGLFFIDFSFFGVFFMFFLKRA